MLETWLAQYGYPMLAAGTFLEGETVMVLGGLAAHMGYLSLDLVILSGFIGSLAGDQLYFLLGRRYGRTLLARYPQWRPRAEQVLSRLERHQNLVVLGFRFMYGLRSISPFAIGLSRISYLRYSALNVIGSAVWAAAVGLAGYYFGRAVETLLGDIRAYELELMAAVIAAAGVMWLVRFARRRQRNGGRQS
jgi:membrane protein DedA with SNARE-associated domain